MKSETVFNRDIKWTFIYPVFTAETKKEEKTAKRMNEFFSYMGSLIQKYASSSAFPDGGKFNAECLHTTCPDMTLCKFILKQRGRTQFRSTVAYEWQKGYIKKTNIM